MIPKRRVGDRWVGSRNTSAAGPASRRGTRLFSRVAFGVTAFAMTSGLAAWVADFDLVGWIQNPASANVATSSFEDRFGTGSLRRSLAIRYPLLRSQRADFNAEFGHIERQLGGQPPSRLPSPSPSNPSRPRNLLKPRFPCREPGRSWPIFSPRGSTRRRRRRTAGPCSRRSPIWCRCASRWRR